MKVRGQDWRSIWVLDEADDNARLGIIDQTRLPYAFETLILSTCDEVVQAIGQMKLRGAPLIGVAGAFALALALREDASDAALAAAAEKICASRPTAINLRWAVERICEQLSHQPTQQRASLAWQQAQRIAEEDVALNKAIGAHGAGLLAQQHAQSQRRLNILTHCNTGWLATVDYGTALSAIYQAFDAGIDLHVWVSETRPRNQGLLTAWELDAHGVPHTLVADNAAGHLMQTGQVDCVLVGADRVSAAGDVCNKVGTYLKAIAARDCGIPFYAAVPTPTIDWSWPSMQAPIPIELRSGDELRLLRGVRDDGQPDELRIAPAQAAVYNPAFDITPARLITALITELGHLTAHTLSTIRTHRAA